MNTNGDSGHIDSGHRSSSDSAASGQEIDNEDEILRLRSEIDDQLRKLNTSDNGPLRVKPESGDSQSVRTFSTSSRSPVRGGETGKRADVVAAWVGFGLLIGVAVSLNIYNQYSKAMRPSEERDAIQSTLQISSESRPSPAPAPKRISQSASVESEPTAPQETDRQSVAVPQPPSEAPSRETSASTSQWQACLDQNDKEGAPPQPGETWWPVVGSKESLADARRHCRSDAFINKSGNAQVSSFRDQSTAAAFAEQLSQDSSHPWNFWVGDPSQR